VAEPIQFNVVTDTNGTLTPEWLASMSIVKRADVGDLTWPYNALPFTHVHYDNGFYRALSGNRADEPGPGEWLLVVSMGGKSPVVQRLTITEKNGVLRAAAGWGVAAAAELAHTALTISIVNYDQVAGASPGAPAKQSRVIARLLPRLELVSMGCLDKTGGGIGGTRFEEFAKGRANLLFADGKLNDGVIFTLFIAQTRQKQVWVKSRSPKPKEWVLVGEEIKAPIAAGEKQPVVGKDLGILDFYEHLNNVGRGTPGTVLEAGVYGHAYVKGPIVWNTYDYATPRNVRDPNDFDGRNKDWVPRGAIDLSYSHLRKSFSPDKGTLRAWGCNHMNNTLAEINAGLRELNNKTPRKQFFLVKLPIGRENMTLDHLKRNIAEFIVSQKIGHTLEHGDAAGVVAYCGAAAQSLEIPCFGAPPGMGSNFGSRDQNLVMHIEAGPQTENELPMRWYELEFGSAFARDALNYVDYNEMRKASLPDPGWATERFIIYHDEALGQQILRLPSGLELYRKARDPYLDATSMTFNGVAGHLYVAPGARADHVQDRDHRILVLMPSKEEDAGVFVGKDGTSVLLKSAAGKKTFTMNADEVHIYEMNHRGGNDWDFSLNPPTKVVNGVLEAVIPAWFW
jgi:hypothetical protein